VYPIALIPSITWEESPKVLKPMREVSGAKAENKGVLSRAARAYLFHANE
jgi:hypothetical protein